MGRFQNSTVGVPFIACTTLLFFLSLSSCQERQLVATVNPGCPQKRCNDSTVEIVHVRARGPNDTIHYIWSFFNKPTVLIAYTSHESNLSVAWNNFPNFSDSISFSPQPYYSFAVLVNQIFEFNDENDTGIMDVKNCSQSYIRSIDMPCVWKKTLLQQNLDSVLLVMDGSWIKNSSNVEEGTFRVELQTYSKDGHGPKLPHLLHSPNATQIELSFLKVVTKARFQKARLAVELVLAANESVKSEIVSTSFLSLDDEHTPGVFTWVDLQTVKSKENGLGGYIQWRPVAYVAEERDIVNSTESHLYSVKNISNMSSKYDGTLLAAYFGSNLHNSLLSSVNISFGASKDGFANKNTSIWTLTVGYGHPPFENFSLMLILIIAACLGIPSVVIFFSGIYLAVGRTYRKDDLLLNR